MCIRKLSLAAATPGRVFVLVLLLLGMRPSCQAAGSAGSPVTERYLRLPLAFERHDTGGGVRYVARGQGYMMSVGENGATLRTSPACGRADQTVSLQFVNGTPATAVAGRELPGKVNYIQGKDPAKWRMGLPTFEQVTERGVYPGIDVVYRGNRQQLEFDLVVQPGADVDEVRLRFAGAEAISLEAGGAVAIRTGSGDLKLLLPAIYQEVEGRRKNVRGSYKLLHNREIAFQVEDYDRKRTLVIDPTISYFALLGGGTSYNYGYGIAVDSLGNAYVAGCTYASDFPLANAAYPQYGGNLDGFVSEINAAGTALVYSTYIGGSGMDEPMGIAVDSTGAAWVTGFTTSPDFPMLNAYQSAGGSGDAMVFKLTPSGSLAYSTYLGEAGSRWVMALRSTRQTTPMWRATQTRDFR